MRLAAALLALSISPAAAEEVALSAVRPGASPLSLRAAASGSAWRIAVRDARGTPLQTIEVESEALTLPPRLADADGDGAADLWVPTMAGNANIAFELWRMRPKEGRFHRAGEVSGIAFARDPSGHLVSVGRNGCCGVSYAFHRFGPDGAMADAFTIERSYEPRNLCSVPTGGEAPPMELRRRYCALPAGAPLPGQVLPVP